MGRRAIPSTTLVAVVRKHFGLTQTELGYLLRLTRGQVAHIEAGRHLFASATEAPLLQLL
jgi:DNA-binding XRE family transcriptional regulator